MSDINFDCPHCGQHIEADEALYGTRVECPTCKGAILIPQKPVEAKVVTLSPPLPATHVHVNVGAGTASGGGGNAPESEEQVFELRPSARAFVGQIVLGILLIPIFGIGLLILLLVWLNLKSIKYRMTTQRLFVQQGLLSRHINEMELYRIRDVKLDQGMFQRMLRVGTVTVLSNDDTTPSTRLVGLVDPVRMKETIRAHYRNARRREGVRPTEWIQP